MREAKAAARRRVWETAGTPERLILDLDATLITSHSEKEGAAGNYKGGFGFHPLLCFEASTGEALSGILRSGNAGPNTASDHIEVLERALAQLPEGAAGPGTLVRCDSAGATHAFLEAVCARGLLFSVGYAITESVRDAILALTEEKWSPAISSDGDLKEKSWVAELKGLGLSSWPEGTRAIVRKERPHPGAQFSFTDHEGHRFQVTLTNQKGNRLARLEQLHRKRADIEDSIRCAKASGLRNLPFKAFAMNAAWLELALLGCDLLSWAKRLLPPGTDLAFCEAPAIPASPSRGQDLPPRARRPAEASRQLAVERRRRARLQAPQGALRRIVRRPASIISASTGTRTVFRRAPIPVESGPGRSGGIDSASITARRGSGGASLCRITPDSDTHDAAGDLHEISRLGGGSGSRPHERSF